MKVFNLNIVPKSKPAFKVYLLIILIQLIVAGITMLSTIYSASESSIDVENIGLSPFTTHHVLGTDELGRDVAKQLLLGSYTTLLLSFIGILLAAVFGVFLGNVSAYLGDDLLKISAQKLIGIMVFFIAFSFLFSPANFNHSILYNYFIPFIISVFLGAVPFFAIKKTKKINIPLDLSLNRLSEIYMTLPPIFIIILLTSIFRPSPFLFVIYCTLSMWPEFFLISRAEILKIKNTLFVDAARSIGQRKLNIIFYHLLPNIASPLLVLFSFGFARLMIIEATLSFLGIGLPPEFPGWGKMILSFHNYPEYWWLLVFPGMLIFINAISIQQIGRYFETNKVKS